MSVYTFGVEPTGPEFLPDPIFRLEIAICWYFQEVIYLFIYLLLGNVRKYLKLAIER